jgi:hypothetical protein
MYQACAWGPGSGSARARRPVRAGAHSGACTRRGKTESGKVTGACQRGLRARTRRAQPGSQAAGLAGCGAPVGESPALRRAGAQPRGVGGAHRGGGARAAGGRGAGAGRAQWPGRPRRPPAQYLRRGLPGAGGARPVRPTRAGSTEPAPQRPLRRRTCRALAQSRALAHPFAWLPAGTRGHSTQPQRKVPGESLGLALQAMHAVERVPAPLPARQRAHGRLMARPGLTRGFGCRPGRPRR